ncbi:MAG: vWA domain-containing protein [Psychroserpens sp.]|uniref:vWA domain-containing protein n=1 Tax=Psychroserpens sp. TaxID=2020870 RepID=UPI003C83769B
MKKIFKTILVIMCMMIVLSCNANEKNQRQNLNAFESKINIKDKHHIKVALLLDTSNSMDGLIDQAKAQLWDMVNELSYAKCDDEKPNLEIALYEYGNDRLNADEGYIRQVLAFSDDLDEISKQLFSLTTNGGNEYCGHVIQTSLNQLKWGNNADDLKLIFIAGNEPFTQGKINYQDATKQAHKSNITVNTIFCGDYNQGIANFWKDGADKAHGDYMAINHNHETTYVATPYDDKILMLNQKLNDTYIAYGHIGEQKMALQAEQDVNASGYSEENAVSRTVSKSSHLYKNSSWDLVDADQDNEFSYESLKKEELPNELKNKSVTEMKAYVSKKRKERKTIQDDIHQLNKKRRAFIASQKEDENNSLENAMINAIKTQAKKKKYTW